MGDLIIKPADEGHLKLQNDAGTTAIEIKDDENAVYISGDLVPSTPLSHRNVIINGAMLVAQRGTSSTVNGYGTVDRFRSNIDGNDENATQAQHALTSSDTGPYELGLRYSLQMTNGNQTSGAGTGDRVTILHRIEAQDIANSGWNYTSSSSYITLSFWCKSSVAQNFYVRLTTDDGTDQNYVIETGSLTADTWTKITKTIPGHANLQFDNNNDLGLDIEFNMFRGTSSTGSHSLNTWGAFNSSVRVPDMTSTWYTTNDATWELTGVQLELGSVATPFEHRSYADELVRCQRYYEICLEGSDSGLGIGVEYNDDQQIYCPYYFRTSKRTDGYTLIGTGTGSYLRSRRNNNIGATVGAYQNREKGMLTFRIDLGQDGTVDGGACWIESNASDAFVAIDDEL